MKFSKIYLVLLLFTSIFTSCSKENSGPDIHENKVSKGQNLANYNNSLWTSPTSDQLNGVWNDMMNKSSVDDIGSFIYEFGFFDWTVSRVVLEQNSSEYIICVPTIKGGLVSSLVFVSVKNSNYTYFKITINDLNIPTQQLISQYGIESATIALFSYLSFEQLLGNYTHVFLYEHYNDPLIQDQILDIEFRDWCKIEVTLYNTEYQEDAELFTNTYTNYDTGKQIIGVSNDFNPKDDDPDWRPWHKYTIEGGSDPIVIHGITDGDGNQVFHFWAWCEDGVEEFSHENFVSTVDGSSGGGTNYNDWDYNKPRWDEDTKECMFAFDHPHSTELINRLEEELLIASCGNAAEYNIKNIIDNVILDLCEEFYSDQDNSESGASFPLGESVSITETLSTITTQTENNTYYQLGLEICEVCENSTHETSCINTINNCPSVGYEDCVNDNLCDFALQTFITSNELILSQDEKDAIKFSVSSCSSSNFEEEAFIALAKHFSNFEIDNLPPGHKIKLIDCASFQWTQVGSGWVSCLNPTNMEVELGTSNINFNIELGCLSYTVPETRLDENGNIVQTITADEASSCAALASNLATVAVKLSMKMFPLNRLNTPGTKTILRKLYKQAYKEAVDKTSCGALGAWGSPIATCNNSNCPNDSSPGIYTDNVIEVTAESLIGECF